MAIYNNIYKGGRKCITKFYIKSINYRYLDKYDGQGGNTSLLASRRELQRVLSYRPT